MKDYFSLSMYKEQMRNLKLPAIILSFLTAFFLVMVVVANVVTESTNEPDWLFPSVWYLFVSPAVSVFLTGLLLKDLRKRNGCDFYHALPVSRRATMVASILAAMSWTLVYMVVPMIIQLAIGYPMGIRNISFDRFTEAFIFGVIVSIYLNGAWWLAHTLTGTRFSHIAVAITILVGPRGFLAILGYMIQFVMPYLLLDRFAFFFHPQNYNLVVGYSVFGKLTSSCMIYTLLLSAVYIGLALFLIRRKPSETAGSPTWSSKIEMVIRVILSCAMCIPALFGLITMFFSKGYRGMLYEDITTVMVLIFYCLTVIFYFLYEIIQTKQVKKAFKHWKGLIWVAAFNVVVVVVVSMIHASVVSTKPEPQEIEAVSLVKVIDLDDQLQKASESNIFPDKKNRAVFRDLIYGISLTDDAIKREVSTELFNAVAEGSNYYLTYSILETQDLKRIYQYYNEAPAGVDPEYDAEMSERAKIANQHVTDRVDQSKYQVGLKIKLTSGKTIYRKLNIPKYVFYEMFEKEEFIRRVDEFDFEAMIRGYQRINSEQGTVAIMVAQNSTLSENPNIMLEALENDIKAMILQQKVDLFFHPVYYTVSPVLTFEDDWGFINIFSIFKNCENTLIVSPELTPKFYRFVENDPGMQLNKINIKFQK